MTGGWLPGEVACWTSGSGSNGLGVVVLPPLGYAYSSSARFLTRVVELLADQGCRVLRLDLPGLGDSGGAPSLGAWHEAVRTAVAALEGLTVTVLGVGWGGTLALRSDDVAGIVAIAPPLAGKRYVRQLRLLGQPFPDGSGGVSVGGYALPGALLEEIAAVTVEPPTDRPVLLVDPSEATAAVLERAAEEAEVDAALIGDVTDWLLALAPGRPCGTRELAPAGRVDGVAETLVTVAGLPGVLAEPEGPATGLLLLLNSGSDPHTGPGRAWVELARFLSRHGWATLRFDGHGWGVAAGDVARPYDPHHADDLLAVIRELRPEWARIVAGGLCAGAWTALQVARSGHLEGVVALNPQLYWDQGDPVEARIDDTNARRAHEIAAIHQGFLDGRWDTDEDLPPAAAWLADLRGSRAELVFAAGDPGLVYLRERLGRQLVASGLTVTEVDGIDHGMQQVWERPRMFAAWAAALERIATAT